VQRQCSATSKNSKESHLVFLLPASFNVLRHFFPAQTHAAAAILLDLGVWWRAAWRRML